jgi:hypothetical protein
MKKPEEGTKYYKLRQTDFDGKTSWSDLIAVNCDGNGVFTVSPNPFKDQLHVEFAKPVNVEMTIVLVDVLGKEILVEKVPFESNTYLLDKLSDLIPGTYYLKIVTEESVHSEKLVKM